MTLPLFEIEPVEWLAPEPDKFDAMLFTSANAIRHAGAALDRLRQLRVHTVGTATADAALAAGFDVAEVGRDGVASLLAALDPGLRLLHLCGQHRTATPGARQAITSIPVYRATEKRVVDTSAVNGAIALVHSRRAARRFAEVAARKDGIAVVAISWDVAEAAGAGWQSVEASDAPTDQAMLALAARLCNTSDPT
jgi:uroporphyrinogen-III synthase